MRLASFKKACYKAYTSPVKLNWAGLAIDICSVNYCYMVYINGKLVHIGYNADDAWKTVSYKIKHKVY